MEIAPKRTFKTCIWCRGTEEGKTFHRHAHTFPRSLGGKNICDNVCDECNSYFGSATQGKSSIEVVLKEALNTSRYLLLHDTNGLLKNMRYKSEFFNIDWSKRKVTVKSKYKFNQHFQEHAGRQLRRGLFKVYLEERERQIGDALSDRFNFVREFARYDLNDLPVFRFRPRHQWVLFQKDDVLNPQIRFTESSQETDEQFRMFDYPIVGHYFALPTSHLYHLMLDSYKKYLKDIDHPFGIDLIKIKRLEDLDFQFRFLN